MSIALITGSTQGTGYGAAQNLLDEPVPPAHIILAVRSPERGEIARKNLLEYYKDHHAASMTNPPEPKITIIKLDLADLASVKAFPEEVKFNGFQHLDTVILNAGINKMDRSLTKDGHEELIQVNYLSNVLLALSLLPLLKAAEKKPAHLDIVGSQMHQSATREIMGFDRSEGILKFLESEEAFSRIPSAKKAEMWQYSVSKLCVAHFVRSLSEKVSKEEVIINHSCPGIVYGTNNDALLPWWMQKLGRVYRRAKGKDLYTGGGYIFEAAKSGPESHGRWVREGKLHEDAETAKDEEVRKKLWDETMEWVGTVEPALKM